MSQFATRLVGSVLTHDDRVVSKYETFCTKCNQTLPSTRADGSACRNARTDHRCPT